MKKSVPVGELKFGMYVAELDRPWTDTPFMFQGFVLKTEQQLEVLKKFCKSVVVDSERSELVEPPAPAPRYTTQVAVEQELPQARAAHEDAGKAVSEVLAAVRANKMLDAQHLE